MDTETLETQPVADLQTTYGRVRCLHPTQVERMKRSLIEHGQLTPVVVTRRAGRLQILDGFKRRVAAVEMGWVSLRVVVREVEEPNQWAMMLLLNRGPHSLSVLEEALVLREMVEAGLSQVQIGELLQRHKSWVSRRIGLIERLHPELVAEIREGILTTGVARRLLSLPPGNQLSFAAVAKKHRLGAAETESLLSLWRQAEEPAVREYVLAQPREALANARAGDPKEPPDPRLSPKGQRLQRALRILHAVAHKATASLTSTLKEEDRMRLALDLELTETALQKLLPALGFARPPVS